MVSAVLDLGQRHCMQHTEHPHQDVLKQHDLRFHLFRVRELAKGNGGGTGIEPLRPHLVQVCASRPEAPIGLRCSKDDQEADQKRETTPDCTVVQWKNILPVRLLHNNLDNACEQSVWQGNHKGKGKNAAAKLKHLEDKVYPTSAIVNHHLGALRCKYLFLCRAPRRQSDTSPVSTKLQDQSEPTSVALQGSQRPSSTVSPPGSNLT
mmetsp:Transcript_33843/g.79100  ORF Transcript_33843/g.79100 Transcript_33843/m.79100 type:complete len:207 (-) Transcript_33843:2-622(-)